MSRLLPCCSLMLSLLLFSSASVLAQTEAPPEQKSPAKSKPPVKTANIRTGEIEKLDIEGEKLSLKEKNGKSNDYNMTVKTHFLKGRKEAEVSEFKVGDAVVLRLRKVRGKNEYTVFEMMDIASYAWMTGLRKDPKKVIIKEMTEAILTVTAGDREVNYTISDKTKWNKAGKEVSQSVFKVGEEVVVVPRSLPGGGIFARIVADELKQAEKLRKTPSGTVNGILTAIEPANHIIRIAVSASTPVALLYTDSVEVRQKGKPVPQSFLKPGMRVSVRVKRDATGTEIATRITIESGGRASVKPKKPGLIRPTRIDK